MMMVSTIKENSKRGDTFLSSSVQFHVFPPAVTYFSTFMAILVFPQVNIEFCFGLSVCQTLGMQVLFWKSLAPSDLSHYVPSLSLSLSLLSPVSHSPLSLCSLPLLSISQLALPLASL